MKNLSLSTFLFCLAILISCKSSEPAATPLEIATQYYTALDKSDMQALRNLLSDSILSKELSYEMSFSKNGYLELQRWDSVFNPSYTILEMKEFDGNVHAKISKVCFRTRFLNGEPIITEETISFTNGKIKSVAIDKYVVFNAQRWDTIRAGLLEFVDETYPELQGFLYDQTIKGALKYTKAIERFEEGKEN